MEILRAESLTFRYPGESRTALDEVSFSVNEGEFVIVCGASGSGKTTLMSLIKPEIAPHGEKTGRLLFRSENLLSDSCGGGFAKIGFVAQNTEKQIISDTVERELAFGICNICKDRETIRRRVGESAAYFGIGGLMKKKTFELSGGQRQLLCLASVMAMSPEVLVLDEPTSSLDPISSAEFISMLRRLNREMGTTVIISCHRLGEVFCDADRIIMLDGGRILSDGAPSEVADAVGKSAISEALPAYIRIFSLTEGRGKVPMSIAEGRDYIRRFGRGMIPDSAPEEVFPRETAVRLKNVYFRYSREERDVICGCCAEIYKGEVFSILGGNGAGKSTLLALLCGLEKAQRGRIDIFSKSIDKYDKNSLFKGTLAALPQDAENLFVGDSVREVLSENHAEAEWLPLARELALEDLLLRNPFDLSGGEAQRLALATVLLSHPKILLLDEPTKSLDSACKKTLSEIILGLKKSGVTVIIVTHDTDFAAEVSDRCAFLFGGEITSVDEPKGFFSENDFYTTQTSRLTRGYFERAVTVADAVRICLENGENDEKIN